MVKLHVAVHYAIIKCEGGSIMVEMRDSAQAEGECIICIQDRY